MAKKTTTYNRILKEFTKINNKLPEDRKLSIKERRKIIKEQVLPKYKDVPAYKVRVKILKGQIFKIYDKIPPKEFCDLNYIDTSEFAFVEWFSLDETIRELVPDCLFVKVTAGEYGETKIFNTRNYEYGGKGVRDIVENIRPDAEGASGKFIFSGYKKLRPRKRNDGTPENYYLDFVLFIVDKKGREKAQGDIEPVDYEVPKTRDNRKKKTKVKQIIEGRIKALKVKKDSRKRAKKTIAKNVDLFAKVSKRVAKSKGKKTTYRSAAWQREGLKLYRKTLAQNEKSYKEGKLTKVQYEKNKEKLMKDLDNLID
jgi:hypothetical protein